MPPRRKQPQPPPYQHGPRLGRKKRRPAMFTFFSMTLGAMLGLIILLVIFKIFAPDVVPIEVNLPSKANQNKPIISFTGTPPGEKVLLVMGVDDARIKGAKDPFEGARTDVMMMVRVSGRRKIVSLVSIPRDSKVYLAEGRGINKINAAHAFGGVDLAVDTVEESFGIPVDNYVLVNYDGVREIVDALGGIDVYVEKRMKYRDRTAGLTVDFEPGQQHLDGKLAESFLRFRHDELGDIGRIRRQQQFLTAVASKMKDPWLLAKLPFVVQTAQKYVRTDLSLSELAGLAAFSRDVDLNKVRSATLPGYAANDPNISYWVIDSDKAQKVLNKLILLSEMTDVQDTSALRVGIFYDPTLKDTLEGVVKTLEARDFRVVCRSPKSKISTQIIEHSERVNDRATRKLRASDNRLKKARLIYAPAGTTFESNACSSTEDYTIVLGVESQQTAEGQ